MLTLPLQSIHVVADVDTVVECVVDAVDVRVDVIDCDGVVVNVKDAVLVSENDRVVVAVPDTVVVTDVVAVEESDEVIDDEMVVGVVDALVVSVLESVVLAVDVSVVEGLVCQTGPTHHRGARPFAMRDASSSLSGSPISRALSMGMASGVGFPSSPPCKLSWSILFARRLLGAASASMGAVALGVALGRARGCESPTNMPA